MVRKRKGKYIKFQKALRQMMVPKAIDKPFKVPSGHVYVLSDKLSAHHDDSRVFGPIATESILGVIW